MMNSWKCTECRNLTYPNYCSRKEIKVDRNFDGPCDLAEPLTNGDRIRVMDNEELADFLAESEEVKA